jgi:hypothetical protein
MSPTEGERMGPPRKEALIADGMWAAESIARWRLPLVKSLPWQTLMMSMSMSMSTWIPEGYHPT